jgi:16S rRNA (cytosine967-C5)-methyltransferase
LKPEAARKQFPEIPWFEPETVEAAIAAEPDPARRLGLSHGLPDFLAARLIAIYGEKAEALAEALSQRGPQTLRANSLKTTREKLLEILRKDEVAATPTANAPTGLTLARRINAFRRPEFSSGLFEVQDESSQLAAEAVAPPPGGLVVDFCAGAGGKTLAIGALMKNKGRLVALETQAFKLTELRKRIARAGLSNAQALAITDTTWPPEVEALKGKAHRVLVDVPCSGTGAFRRNPEGRWRLQADDLTRLPALQLSIARRAMALVAPGGRLIYATCSIMNEENEDVIERLLAGGKEQAGAWELVLMKEILGGKRAKPICDAGGKYLKLLPSVHGCDGFFAAVLRRKDLPAAAVVETATPTTPEITPPATPDAASDSAD